ncbi:hypothetical protein DMB71_03090 [Flavobacterium tistrianum]|nr:hypothetical protein DMB71_03090 [Flavobacterium tistrianum]
MTKVITVVTVAFFSIGVMAQDTKPEYCLPLQYHYSDILYCLQHLKQFEPVN